jgi:NOL1/NOP2/fmu family ribosome biogenesis protein
MKYTRNELGQFCSNKTKRNVKRKTSSSAKLPSVRNGSIYSWRGQLVRVRKDLNNGLKLVSVHNNLFGFAKQSELIIVNKDSVDKYLE